MPLQKREPKFVEADVELCTGCTVCEFACALEKDGKFSPLRSRIRAVRIYPHSDIAIACRVCEDAPCVTACPRKALVQSEETGLIIIDDDKCDGCGWCVEACDFGAATIHPDTRKAIFCDLCQDREAGPACIEFCPPEALSLISRGTVATKSRIDAAKKLFAAAEDAKS
jgi:Fe-S-cluster-containing hydrogenase component 2